MRSRHLCNKLQRILIVGDEDAIGDDDGVHVLSTCPVATWWSPTPEKREWNSHENKFDLITLDIDLTDINGFEIYSNSNKSIILAHTPVVFVFGRPCEQDIQRGLELRAVDYITKPFGVEFVPRLLSHIQGKNQFNSSVGETI